MHDEIEKIIIENMPHSYCDCYPHCQHHQKIKECNSDENKCSERTETVKKIVEYVTKNR